jgi:hypothetical protein
MFCHLNIIGWPKVIVLSLSKDKIINSMAAVIGSCLCPITISCVLYASMICIKQRKFLNTIAPTTETQNANIESVIPDESNVSSLEEILQEQTNNADAQEVIQIFQEKKHS